MNKDQLDTPVAIVDLDILRRNIKNMAGFAGKAGVNLRPHVKTHKIPAIAHKQIDAGAIGVTVAKLGEAEVMAAGGIKDIFIAYQIVGKNRTERLINLTRQVRISVAVDNLKVAAAISSAAKKRKAKIDVIMMVDMGFKRCGVLPGKAAIKLAQGISQLKGLRFKGIMTYAGHAYVAGNQAEMKKIAQEEGKIAVETADMIRKTGLAVEVVSVGSTPTCKVSGLIPGVTEIRPGTYVFNDMMEVHLKVARIEDCALRVLSTVISRPARDRAIIDAGDKTLSPDRGLKGMKGYGCIVDRPDVMLETLHEEHGILRIKNPSTDIEIGDKVEIIPNHVCAVVNLFDQLVGVRKNEVKEVWQVAARGKVK